MKNNRKKPNGWLLKIAAIVAFCFVQLAMNNAYSQCQPYIKVDGNLVIANSITPTGLTLPLWLTAGQTLAADQMVSSVSVIEFTINATTNDLDFSRVITVTTSQPVPANKVWKIESIVKKATLTNSNGAVFTGAGTYSLTVPSCASYICIELWGAGGGGGPGNNGSGGSGGGGGGGYGQGCFTVTPGQSLSITIGTAGSGGSSGSGLGTDAGATSVTGTGVSISASGGLKGTIGAGGAGGSTITASVAVPGGAGGSNGSGGAAGGSQTSPGGAGGAAGGGSVGGIGANPGGGGGGVPSGMSGYGGSGGTGRVSITW